MLGNNVSLYLFFCSACMVALTFLSCKSDEFPQRPLLPAPQIVSPHDGKVDLDMGQIKFSCAPVDTALTYLLQVSRSPDFWEGDYGPSPTPEFVLTDFPPSATFYWRMRYSTRRYDSHWSEPFSFTTTHLRVPFLLEPDNGSSIEGSAVEIIWTFAPKAHGYHLQVSTMPDFSVLQFETTYTSETMQLVEGLSGNTTYYWRVRSVRQTDVSAWSDTFSFKTSN
jgi:hypothetical protein